jgi:hypothetical protein
MTIAAWVAAGVAAWLVVSALVGLWIAAVIRRRDRPIPHGEVQR